jgi:hypothetical protein
MYSKAEIYNLALGALLLSRRITDTDTDKSNECNVLNTHFKAAFAATLADLNLDSTSTQTNLELIEQDPNDLWDFSYKYPSDCAFFRRLQSPVINDDRSTHIDKRVAIKGGKKCIFTNEVDAIIEYISTDVPLSSLSATAGLAVAYRLASMSSPLVTGKGSKTLMESIQKTYMMTKAEAQEQDRLENFVFNDPSIESEFVKERLS